MKHNYVAKHMLTYCIPKLFAKYDVNALTLEDKEAMLSPIKDKECKKMSNTAEVVIVNTYFIIEFDYDSEYGYIINHVWHNGGCLLDIVSETFLAIVEEKLEKIREYKLKEQDQAQENI